MSAEEISSLGASVGGDRVGEDTSGQYPGLECPDPICSSDGTRWEVLVRRINETTKPDVRDTARSPIYLDGIGEGMG